MAAFSDWRDGVMPALPGAIQEAVEFEFLQTVREFCRQTRVFFEELPAVGFSVDIQSYTLSPSTPSTDVSAVDNIRFFGRYVGHPTRAVYDDTTTRGAPAFWWVDQLPQVKVFPIPDQDYSAALEARVVLQPSSASAVPEFFVNTYYEAIRAGTLARMQEQPGKPYSNPNLYLKNRRIFLTELGRARRLRRTSYSRELPTWCFPAW